MGEGHGLRVAVYAISKDESRFVDRWMDSMAEADEIVVLDTGSTDDTVEKLRARGARVEQRVFHPWRFDVARNAALKLVSEDVDVCCSVDLDEVFEPGWRQALEKAWAKGADQLQYRYTWNFDEQGNELTVFFADKIHARHGFTWHYPVHEVILPDSGESRIVQTEELRLYHQADDAKSRGQYLPLLELAAEENPMNDRSAFYLGREYFFHGQYRRSMAALEHYLWLPTAKWRDERAAAMRYLARCCHHLKLDEMEVVWERRAVEEAPYLREPWLDAARGAYRRGDWREVIRCTQGALRVTERHFSYLSESEAWGSLLYDMQSMAYYYLGENDNAAASAKRALEIDPTDERIRANLAWFEGRHGAGEH